MVAGVSIVQSSQEVSPSEDKTSEALLDAALNALAKALKAINFYPAEHPLRDESVASALLPLIALTERKELILLWSRDSCALAERTSVKSTSSTAKSLAREMLMRKLQRLIILPELSLQDLRAFLVVVTTEPADIFAKGGIETVMRKAGITTIFANEVDLSLLRGLANEGSDFAEEPLVAAGGNEQAEDEPPEEEEPLEEEAENPADLQFSLLGIDILLGMLKAETRETQFLQLAREVMESAEELKRQEAFAALLPVIGTLLEIHNTEGRAASQKEFIRYSLEQIASGSMTVYLLDRIEERAAENEVMFDSLCGVIGQSFAYPLIQRLCVAESLHTRKAIARALTRSGEGAIAALVPMLKDERWYVVRNMVTILGEIAFPDSLRALQQTALHPEAKVRKEVVKSLVKIAPQAGEHTLVSMLADSDREVVRQVIFSLGVLRSRAAVRPLLDIVTEADAFLKELELKKLAVSALGRIGDRQATGPLLDILETIGWLAPLRWAELKTAVAVALGQLGDESALPLLKKLAKRDSPLGEACSDAADNLERVVK